MSRLTLDSWRFTLEFGSLQSGQKGTNWHSKHMLLHASNHRTVFMSCVICPLRCGWHLPIGCGASAFVLICLAHLCTARNLGCVTHSWACCGACGKRAQLDTPHLAYVKALDSLPRTCKPSNWFSFGLLQKSHPKQGPITPPHFRAPQPSGFDPKSQTHAQVFNRLELSEDVLGPNDKPKAPPLKIAPKKLGVSSIPQRKHAKPCSIIVEHHFHGHMSRLSLLRMVHASHALQADLNIQTYTYTVSYIYIYVCIRIIIVTIIINIYIYISLS